MAVTFTLAVLVPLIGAGVLLYERFSEPAQRLALMTLLAGTGLAAYALAGVSDGGRADWWFRVGLAVDALLAPSIYLLALAIVRVRRPGVVRGAWALGVGLCVWSLASPTLAIGVGAIAAQQLLTPASLAAGAYIAFIGGVIAATFRELLVVHRSVVSREDRRRVRTLAAAFAVGSLGMADFAMSPLPFGGIGVAPFGVVGATILFGYAAMRYRAFAPLPAFAGERVLEVMSDGLLLCDGEGRIRTANPAALRLLDRTESGLAGAVITDLIPGDASAGAVGILQLLRQGVRDYEHQLLRGDGQLLEASLSSDALYQDAAFVGLLVTFRDIGERLRAARELKATEERYESLFWSTPALVFEFDLDGRFVHTNPAVEQALGLTQDELRGRFFGEFMDEHALADAAGVFARVSRGDASEYQLRMKLPAGGALELRGMSIPVVREGKVVGVFGVGLDITEEERARRDAEMHRLEFEALFEASPEAIVICDEEDRVTRLNPEFSRLFGYSLEEARGRFLDDLIVPPDLVADGIRLSTGARGGNVVRAETVRRRKDGSLADVSVLARELLLPTGPPRMYGIYRDITEVKEAERKLRQRDEELRHSQRLEAVGKLAGGVAHDFNNLVTVINGHVLLALDGLPEDSALRSDLEEVSRAGMRAANLTQQLLAFSRRQVLRLETVDTGAVVSDLQRMFDRIIGEHISFVAEHSGDVRVTADRGQLEQMLVNLIMNARDSMPHGGEIRVAAERVSLESARAGVRSGDVPAGEYVRLEVSDTGAGMDQGTLNRAFEPFFTTKERGRGTGLGLATVFGIVKQSGGDIALASEPGLGTTVTIWLPVAAASSQDATPLPAEWVQSGTPADSGLRAHILVVEDEEPLRRLVVRVLQRAGHDVTPAGDGEEGLRMALEQPFDLVLSDLVMPRMGGHELARSLRSARPELPVVLMSGYDDEITTRSGGSAIFNKPFTPAALVRRVEEALNGVAA